ncbi:MAG TPA: hypothetical protein PLX92_06415 [Anaerolineaceae bacterium]|jgi:hypothetical protein|nr:hypothetical protein [Anaerolineaceae bacterium]HOV30614.1 hypothetical protein [Anaerolineaceae bacterium]HUM49823.1 hypothetical protein [Anaerolineaceae bacterium]
METLNDDDLRQFMQTFYGYGNLDGRFWFIGMEEGGGNSLEEMQARLKAWKQLGKPELADLRDFHLLLRMPEFFTNPVKLQRTWMQIAKITLVAKGQPHGLEALRTYQQDYLGRKNGEICLMELLPLPSPRTSAWAYAQWSTLPFLAKRETYYQEYYPQRSAHIARRIQENQPKVVIFYGIGYRSFWQAIAGKEVEFQNQDGFLSGITSHTVYLIIKHPNARKLPHTYFEMAGAYLREHLQT